MHVAQFVATLAAICGLATTAMAGAETVLVAGASGRTGVELVKVLRSQGYQVRAMVRDREKAGSFGPGVEVVQADVTTPDSLGPAVSGATYVVSAIGAGSPEPPNNPENVDYRGVASLAAAARAAGVRRFVLLSSIGAGNEDPDLPLNKMFGMVLMWKGKGEEALRQSGVPYTIVRPGGLLDCVAPGRAGLKMAPGNAPVRGSVCRADVALVMADALTAPDAVGRTIALVGDDTAPALAWKDAWSSIPKD